MLGKWKEEIKGNKTVKNGLYLGLFIAILSVAVIFGNLGTTESNKKTNEEKAKEWETYLTKIGDNYDIEVRTEKNKEAKTISFSRENSSYQITTGDFEHELMLLYKNKWYYLNDYKIISMKTNEIKSYFNFRYMDLELISKLLAKAKVTSREDDILKMEISIEDYLKEYNYLYDEMNKTDSEDKISMEVKVDSESIKTITIDYSSLDKYFNNTEDELIYKITVKTINNAYFESTIEEYFKFMKEEGSEKKLKEFFDSIKDGSNLDE